MSAASPPAGTGAQFGKYRIVRKLGEGAFGAVFEALLPGPMGFAKRVAIKMLRTSVVDADPKFVQSMVNEARIGGLLHHGNIVDVLEFDQVGEHYYLAMEFVDGLTLAEVIRVCRDRQALLPRFATLELVGDVCRGLHYAHEFRDPAGRPLDLIHRDLKPSNIIVNAEGRAKILDFGIAKAASNLFNTTASAVSKGTPRYMSPEQVSCDPLTARSDLFSLGAVMFELITGRVLFDADNIGGLVMKILSMDLAEPLDQAEAAFPGARPLLARALQKEPGDRYPTAQEMGDDVRELAKRYPAEADMSEVFARLLPACDRSDSQEIRDAEDLDFETRVYQGEDGSFETTPIPPPDTASVGWEHFSAVFAEPTPVSESEARTEAWDDATTVGGPAAAPRPPLGARSDPPPPRGEPATAAAAGGRSTLRLLVGGTGLVAVAVLAVFVLSDRLQPNDPRADGDLDATGAIDAPSGGELSAIDGIVTDAPDPTPAPPAEPAVSGDEPPRVVPVEGIAPPQITEPATAGVEPAGPPRAAGTVSIRSKPYARIYVDGVLIKEGNVLSRHALEGGVHTVRLVCPNHGDVDKEFSVDIDGQDASLGCWDFDKGGPCGS